MNNLDLLKEFRSNVPETELGKLTFARENLQAAIELEKTDLAAGPVRTQTWVDRVMDRTQRTAGDLRAKFIRPRTVGWSAVAAGVAVFGIVAATVVQQPSPAQAALTEAANSAITYTSLTPEDGSYVKMTIHEPDHISYDSRTKEFTSGLVPRTVKFLSGDPASTGALQHLEVDSDGVVGDTYETEALGAFNSQTSAQVPTESGEAAFEYFDSNYTGASASRDEDNFVRITDLLRLGVLQAETRSALLAALALVPGVETSGTVPNALGELGVAFSRTEEKRADQRVEILIDTKTGLFIGERYIEADGEVSYLTAITYELVDSAPQVP